MNWSSEGDDEGKHMHLFFKHVESSFTNNISSPLASWAFIWWFWYHKLSFAIAITKSYFMLVCTQTIIQIRAVKQSISGYEVFFFPLGDLVIIFWQNFAIF